MKQAAAAFGAVMMVCSAQAVAVTPDDFKVQTTRDLVKLCKVDPDADLYSTARAFCLGYVDGTWDYHLSLTGPLSPPIACPGPDVTRDQAIEVYLDWAKKHADQFKGETPVNGLMRAFTDKWPCT